MDVITAPTCQALAETHDDRRAGPLLQAAPQCHRVGGPTEEFSPFAFTSRRHLVRQNADPLSAPECGEQRRRAPRVGFHQADVAACAPELRE